MKPDTLYRVFCCKSKIDRRKLEVLKRRVSALNIFKSTSIWKRSMINSKLEERLRKHQQVLDDLGKVDQQYYFIADTDVKDLM